MQAHVICCNDRVEHVVIGTEERAKEVLEQLAAAYFEHMKGSVNPSFKDEMQEQAYRRLCYWHIHTTPCEINGYLHEGAVRSKLQLARAVAARRGR